MYRDKNDKVIYTDDFRMMKKYTVNEQTSPQLYESARRLHALRISANLRIGYEYAYKKYTEKEYEKGFAEAAHEVIHPEAAWMVG